jgi:PAS domain S-box-containing protein
VKIRKLTGEPIESNWVKDFLFLDLEIDGEQAHLIVFENIDNHTSMGFPLNLPKIDSLLSIMPGVAYQCRNDKNWTIMYLSEGCFQLTGYNPEDLISNKKLAFADLIHPEDRESVWDEVQAALSKNQPFQLLYRIQNTSGEYRSVQEQGKGLFDENGELVGLEGWIIDITERKKIDDALLESEERYRSLIQISPDSVVLATRDGKIIFTNQQLASMLEFDSSEDLIGKNILEFLVTNSKQHTELDIIRRLTGDQTHRGNYDIQTMSGKVIPVEVNIRAIIGQDSKPSAFIGVVQDVSERDTTLQALKTSEARYRAIVEDTPEMIVRYTPDGEVTFANQAYCSYYGLNPEDLIGSNLIEKVPESSKKTIERILAFVTPDMTPATKEHTSQLKKGEVHWYRWKTQSIHNDEGKFIEYQSIGEDISDEKKVEKSRLQSETHFQTLMESIKLIAINLDIQGNLTFCNSHFLEVTGWTKEEVIGKNWMENFVPPDVAIYLRKVLLESALGGKIPQHYENMIITRKGELRLISWNNTLLRDNHGVVNAIASIGEDITEKYYSEKTQEVIYKISQSTNESGDLDALFRSIHAALQGLMPAENFFIALYDPAADLLSFPYFVDEFDSQPPPQKPGRGLTEYVLRTGKPLLANPEVFNLLVEENEIESVGPPSVDWMASPLKIENRVIGVMGTQTYSEGVRFKKRDEQMISFVSTQVAMAIERKRAEQELKSSQERNQLLVEASTDGIFLETLEGRILDCNQVVEQMYGYSRDELLSMNVIDMVSPEFAADKLDYVVWELEQGGRLSNLPNIRKDGTLFPVEVSTRLTGPGNNQFVVTYVRDITEQKKVERAILESESKFRTLAQTAAAGIFIHRGENYLYVNPMWCEITGYTEEELLKMSFLDAITQEELGVVKQKYFDRIHEGTESIRYETVIFSKIGEKKWVDITAGLIDYEG